MKRTLSIVALAAGILAMGSVQAAPGTPFVLKLEDATNVTVQR